MSQFVYVGERPNSNHAPARTVLLNLGNETRLQHDGLHYYVHNIFLGMSMFINKRTNEAQTVKRLLDGENVFGADYIRQWLTQLFLTSVEPADLEAAANKKILQSFQEGQRSKAQQIRRALFMENGFDGNVWYDPTSAAGLSDGDTVVQLKANPTQGT
jgi:hypothetical protein